MIVEKPAWLRHEGLQIFSIDIQPGGHRFATAGGDHKVRIWDMKYLSPKEADLDPTHPKLLATLRDHFGSVNCVRWAKFGRLIASGSDDQIVLIHERRPGCGTTEFGSGEPPDVENWKVLLTLRGHSADVVDLAWSPDDSLLASCSLDNSVHVWNTSNGSHVAVLKGHTSLVKGVAWDPIGSFLASQSDDKTVIIWRTGDWSLANRIEGHWEKTVGSTFFRRLAWSPCGHFITTTNGFQKPRHSAPVLERGDWTASFDFLGHNAPIVAVRFNNSLYRKQLQDGVIEVSEGLKSDSGGQVVLANGGLKSTSKELKPYNVIAMGSQDCSITVWTTTSPRPVFVGKHFFSQSVVDLSWSPDGYSLFCCSLDGTVAAFHFEVKELGYRLSDTEFEELKKSRYGDARGRQIALAESSAQLLLEAAAAKQWGGTGVNDQTNSSALAGQTASGDLIGPQVTASNVPVGLGTTVGNGTATNVLVKASQTKMSSPVKQREYRRPDGRRRIIPEPVGPQNQEESIANGPHHERSESVLPVSGQKRDFHGLHNVDTTGAAVKGDERNISGDQEERPAKRINGTSGSHQYHATAGASLANSLIIEMGLNSADASLLGLSSAVVDPVTTVEDQNVKGTLSITVSDEGGDKLGLPLCLEARPFASIASGTATAGIRQDFSETEIICSKGGEVQWRDRLAGKATVLAGNPNMWVVGCEDGNLQVYTRAGRRALPCMVVGSAPAFLDCDGGWKLLLLTRRGSLFLWDLSDSTCLLKESLVPLLPLTVDSSSKGSVKVVSARLSRCGAPLVVLANRHAFLFHMNMRCWLRVADDCFPASSFSSLLSSSFSAGEGELAVLEAEAADAANRNFKWNRALIEDKTSTRAHLEAKMASALALKSPAEYRECLLAYTRYLTREGDETRLRELCEHFLGPPFANEAGLRRDSFSLGHTQQWESTILGMKKHELLKTEVLPAMASNRKTQRILSEYIDLLSEQEAREQSLQTPGLRI